MAARPSHAALAGLAITRLPDLSDDVGLTDPDALLGPFTSDESAATGLSAGEPMLRSVLAILRAALAAPAEELIDRGVVTSAETLAGLAPRLAAAALAGRVTDPGLAALVARTTAPSAPGVRCSTGSVRSVSTNCPGYGRWHRTRHGPPTR